MTCLADLLGPAKLRTYSISGKHMYSSPQDINKQYSKNKFKHMSNVRFNHTVDTLEKQAYPHARRDSEIKWIYIHGEKRGMFYPSAPLQEIIICTRKSVNAKPVDNL